MNKRLLILILVGLICSCSGNKLEKKGFQVTRTVEDEKQKQIDGVEAYTLELETRPKNVLLTGNAAHRLIPIYKVNYDKRTKKSFIGSNHFHTNHWSYGESEGNQWNRNFMPGFEAVSGYNLINISHYNHASNTEHTFFDSPVLVKTLYYPTFSKDTLNHQPVWRNYYMVSVYDTDTNEDGYINWKDLRRFYHFDINAENPKPLVPQNYSVMSSEYDPANDYMYVFARLDENENGQMESTEAMHVFWIDLANPENRGVQYQNAGFVELPK